MSMAVVLSAPHAATNDQECMEGPSCTGFLPTMVMQQSMGARHRLAGNFKWMLSGTATLLWMLSGAATLRWTLSGVWGWAREFGAGISCSRVPGSGPGYNRPPGFQTERFLKFFWVFYTTSLNSVSLKMGRVIKLPGPAGRAPGSTFCVVFSS